MKCAECGEQYEPTLEYGDLSLCEECGIAENKDWLDKLATSNMAEQENLAVILDNY